MTPYEVMLSESQERMLLIISPENKTAVDNITEKWDLHSDVIGRVTDDGRVKIRDDGATGGRSACECTDRCLHSTESTGRSLRVFRSCRTLTSIRCLCPRRGRSRCLLKAPGVAERGEQGVGVQAV